MFYHPVGWSVIDLLFPVDLDVEIIVKRQKQLQIKSEKRREGCTAMILVEREAWEVVVRKFVRDHTHLLVISLQKRCPTFVSFNTLFKLFCLNLVNVFFLFVKIENFGKKQW